MQTKTKTKTEHTPGPWKVNKINGGYHIGGRAYGIPNVLEVATVTALKEGSEANAQLIAAAPELLNALRFVLSQLAPEGTNGEQCVLYSDCLSPKETDDETVVQYLRATITKAEGSAR